jgi:hypothetical protein
MALPPITLHPASAVRALGAVALFLILASVGGVLAASLSDESWVDLIARRLDVEREWSVPTAFSTLLLLFASLLLGLITAVRRRQTGSPEWHWAILSIGFFAMAADEALSFHEMLIQPGRRLLGGGDLGFLYFPWVVPGIALVLVLALFFWRFVLELPPRTRGAFLLAAAVYLGGAIGVEIVGARIVESHGPQSAGYVLLTTVEEGLEMAGILLFIRALLNYLAENYREVRFTFAELPTSDL